MPRRNDDTEQNGQQCELVICYDPETKDYVVRPRGNCPTGYIEKAKSEIQDRGLVFETPKVRDREIDPEEYEEFLKWRRKQKKRQEEEEEE